MQTWELRRLTRDVKNPEHDGRKRYGVEKLPVFREGTVFIRRETEEEIIESRRIKYLRIEIVGQGNLLWTTNRETEQRMVENSEPVEPNDWATLSAHVLGSASLNFAAEVLDLLLKEGGDAMRQVIEGALRKVSSD